MLCVSTQPWCLAHRDHCPTASGLISTPVRMPCVSTQPWCLAHRDHCPTASLLNVSAHRVYGRPVLLLPILRPICARPFVPFQLDTVSHCHDVLRVCSRIAAFQHSVDPHNRQYLRRYEGIIKAHLR